MKAIFFYCILCILYLNVYTRRGGKKFEKIEVEKVNAHIKGGSQGFLDDNSMKDEDYQLLARRDNQQGKELRCISCNNVETSACSNPKAKTVFSEICPDPEDRCLSLHTPFGIVKRSCFNLNRKQLLYFCVCDLCNDIAMNSVHNMLFTVKRDWVENVAEISHAMRLRRSIKSNVKCLHCELKSSNDSDQHGACQFGKYQSIQTCLTDEVCGIRVVSSRGTIIRGCVGGPVYNYLYSFCDTNDCNDDPLVSVYDPD